MVTMAVPGPKIHLLPGKRAAWTYS